MKIKDEIKKYKDWKNKEPFIKTVNIEKLKIEANLSRNEIIITRKAFDSGISDTIIYLAIDEAEKVKDFLSGLYDE